MVNLQRISDSVAIVVVIGLIIITDQYLLGVIAVLLLRIVDVLIDIRDLLQVEQNRETLPDSSLDNE